MSYILDALRRAESERERGQVPHLHSPSAPVAVADEGAAARAMPWPWAVAALLALLLIGLAVWQWPSSREPLVPAAPPRLQAPAPAQPPATVPLGPAMTRVEPPQAAPPAAPPVAARPAVPPFVPTPAAAPAREVAAADRLPTASELPEALRRELPPLTASGAMYSDTPANRMLIINGQLFHEGDKVAPNLVLEQIKLKGAVLSFKGQRFAISF